MRAAAILGLGSSMGDLRPFQIEATEWMIGLPASREGLDAILVFGGDGTVHRHLGGLAELGLPVLVVPAGSGNDFARALGVLRVRDSFEAWRKFISGGKNIKVVDLGVITPRDPNLSTAAEAAREEGVETARLKARADTTSPEWDLDTRRLQRRPVLFSCAAGVGLDGEIARRANRLPRWLRSHGGYALSLPSALLGFRPVSLSLSVDRRSVDAECFAPDQSVLLAVFANTPFYGGGMNIAPRARMDDGLLDICVIRDMSKLKLMSVFPSVYFGQHLGFREVGYFPAAGARVETGRALDVYADGEYVCQTPVDIGVAPSALRVIVPQ
jgi:diacylglycerol kinase family enzyme